MRNEEPHRRERLRRGLPRTLAEDPDKLNDLLGLNRRERRFMAKLAPPEARAAVRERLQNRADPRMPGEEERLLVQWHYSQPGWRRQAWDDALREPGSGPPSLLAIVLAEFVEAERESPRTATQSADQGTESERIADRAWADTRERLGRWDELGEPEREQCVLRTFAVATIRDDTAVLAESIELVGDLREQFRNVLPEEEQVSAASSSETEEASHRWVTLAGSLRELVQRAEGPPPAPDLLPQITAALESLRELETPVRAEADRTAFDLLLHEVREQLAIIQSDPAFGLDQERSAAIEEAWEQRRGGLSGDALDNERRQFHAAVGGAVDEMREAIRDLADVKDRIADHRAEEPDDPFGQDDWDEKLEDLQRRERRSRKRRRDARSTLLTRLAPGGEPLSPAPKPKPQKPTASEPEPPEPEPPQPKPPEPEPPEPEPPKPEPPEPEPPEPVSRKPSLKPEPLVGKAEEAIVRALMDEPPRLAYAFQLAALAERVFPEAIPLRSELLHAVLLADRLHSPDGPIAMRLRDILGEFQVPDPDWSEDELAIQATVRFAACLRPALFAPITPAFSVLSGLPRSERFPRLHALGHRLAGHAGKLQGARVDASFIRALRSEAELEDAKRKRQEAIADWKRDAPRKTMPYQPATAVWQRLVRKTGPIGQVMANLDAETVRGEAVAQIVQRWRTDRSWVERRVAETDRNLRGSLHSGAGIKFKALERIVVETQRAGDLAQGYLDLAVSSSGGSDYRVRILSELRHDLERAATEVLRELTSRAKEAPNSVRAGARLAAYAVENLRATLDPQRSAVDSDIEPNPDDLVASGWFASRIVLDGSGAPAGDPRDVLKAVLNEPPMSLRDAASKNLATGDLFAAHRILDWAERENFEDVHDLRTELDSARKRLKIELQNEMRLQRDRIESGLMLGVVSAEDRERLDPALFDCERQLAHPGFLRFREMRERQGELKEELDRMEREHLISVQEDFERLPLSSESPRADAINRAIKQRDIVAANELIELARTHPDSDLPESEGRDSLGEFFPIRAKEINDEIESAGGIQEVLDRLRRGRLFGDLPGGRRDSAVRMLRAWIWLKGQRRLEVESERRIGALLSEIGFVVRHIEAKRTIPNVCDIATVPLESRDQSPVPVYGSGARGKYSVICCWNRPAVEDLMQYTHQRGGGAPPIVLYFGRLSERQRKDLAVGCRDRRETLIVLDETVLAFLAGERGSRLSAFFHCTLPFTYVMPYHTQGGIAPPEMFFGRLNETRDVRSSPGPCFIYGGRQLGKTAILRAVAQREHQPQENHFARWIDLRELRESADIWSLLWRELRAAEAISEQGREPSTKSRAGVDSFLNALIQQFLPDRGRKLLLLLDEADRFLEEDAHEREAGVAATGYRESIRLKRLMDDTDGCIKVVFAGLHNVVRTADQVNHPLGQFGRPVQVGPLLRNGEMLAARDLLVRPLLAAGYRLPAELVTRILARTNYYPSLIQLYGEALIKAMGAEPFADALPQVISERVVEDTYRFGNLRQDIRSKFQLTLDLDKRYEVIAYAIARLSGEEHEALTRGISRQLLQAEAQEWWREGFTGTNAEHFESLLDEMDGLGVLRRLPSGNYALRNPNVLLLMGTQEQIEERLLEERELPQEFKPRILRPRRRPEDPADPSRSPLTLQQQDRLFAEEDGIVLLSGVPAGGSQDLLDTYGSRRDRPLVGLKGLPDRESFVPDLRRSVKRQEVGLRVYAVPEDAPWTEAWIRDAQSYLKSLRKSNRNVRVLFLASNDRLLEILRDPTILKLPMLKEIRLEPWQDAFLRQWMQDVAIGDSPDLRCRIRDLTGAWPGPLMRLHQLSEDLGSVESGLANLATEFKDSDQQEKWLRQLCLEDSVTRAVLRPLTDYGELRREEIVEEAAQGELTADEVVLRLRWADHLNLVQQGPKWSINSLVGRLVGESAR